MSNEPDSCRGEPGADSVLLQLLAFARELQDCRTFGDLLETARREVERVTGYRHAWLMVKDDETDTHLRIVEVAGLERSSMDEVAPLLDVHSDPFVRELLSRNAPLVIEDARTDPLTDKQIVEKFHNRTLIGIPLILLEAPFGAFAVGSFGDEPCRAPTPAELQYLSGMASQISVAASRLRWQERKLRSERERAALERRLSQVQRLESLGLLAGGIAHDFNNLLTILIGSATFAKDRVDDAQALVDLDEVLHVADRARSLTQQLLAVSRTQELVLRPLDLNLVLVRLLRMMRRVLPESVEIEFVEGQGLPLFDGDSSQIEQVFMNLLINARDAMPNGGRITIETESVLVDNHYAETHPWAKPGRYVLVTVTDTGTGMTREVLDRIFEPFFTTKGPKAGTGLGLAVSYGIVRQHEGMLHCYSEIGVGTVFKVYVPATRRESNAVENGLRTAVPSASGYVLVAEDDEAVRRVATRILKSGGYRVKSVGDGMAAYHALEEESFDLVLMDVVMPGLSCREAIERARQARPGIRILLSSGYTVGEAVNELVNLSGLQILRKPYDPSQMLRAVSAALAVETPAPGASELANDSK